MLCIRITYLGELGYELYIPAEQATHVYDRLVEAGAALGLRHAGLKALASLRMEKGYRDYGHDIDNTDSVLEAGLGFAVALDKPSLHRPGRGARAQGRRTAEPAAGPGPAAPTPSRCCTTPRWCTATASRSATSGPPRTGTRSAARSGWPWWTVERGPLDQSWLDSGEWTVEVAGVRYPAVASLRPLYDPGNARIRM